MLTSIATGYTAISAFRSYMQYNHLMKKGTYVDTELVEYDDKEIHGLVIDYTTKKVEAPFMINFGFPGFLGLIVPLTTDLDKNENKTILNEFSIKNNEKLVNPIILSNPTKQYYINTQDDLKQFVTCKNIQMDKYAFPLPIRVKEYTVKPNTYILYDKMFRNAIIGTNKHSVVKKHVIRSRASLSFSIATIATVGLIINIHDKFF